MERILPLVKKHGAAVIGMANDETGISMVPEERLALARRIIERAADHGIPQEDVIIDPIAMTVAADPLAGQITLATMRLIRDELGNNMTCGASNVSFGLPDRAHGQRRVPAGGDVRRPDVRDHQPARSPRCGAAVLAVGPAARPRRVRDEVDQALSRGAGGDLGEGGADSVIQRKLEVTYLPFDRSTRVPPGTTAVQRRALDRPAHRLHLRRPRHVRQVQGAGASRARRPRSPADHRQLRQDEIDGRLAALVPGAHLRGHDVRGAAAAARAEGRDDGPRPARHPRPQRAQGLPRARASPTLEDQRSDVARLQRRARPSRATTWSADVRGAAHAAAGASRAPSSRSPPCSPASTWSRSSPATRRASASASPSTSAPRRWSAR